MGRCRSAINPNFLTSTVSSSLLPITCIGNPSSSLRMNPSLDNLTGEPHSTFFICDENHAIDYCIDTSTSSILQNQALTETIHFISELSVREVLIEYPILILPFQVATPEILHLINYFTFLFALLSWSAFGMVSIHGVSHTILSKSINPFMLKKFTAKRMLSSAHT